MTTEDAVTAEAADSPRATGGPRRREPPTALIRHPHAFTRETRLTRRGWEAAIAFPTRTGQTRTDTGPEFILLSDGSVGALGKGTGRHPCRPGGAHLGSDAVSAVKESLANDFIPTDDPAAAGECGVPNPFRHARFDLVLERS